MSAGVRRSNLTRWFGQMRQWFGPKPAPATSRTVQDSAWSPTHRHKKGGEYRVVGHGILEADRSDVVIYDDEAGTIWVRSKLEFYDGRFTALRIG